MQVGGRGGGSTKSIKSGRIGFRASRPAGFESLRWQGFRFEDVASGLGFGVWGLRVGFNSTSLLDFLLLDCGVSSFSEKTVSPPAVVKSVNFKFSSSNLLKLCAACFNSIRACRCMFFHVFTNEVCISGAFDRLRQRFC